MQTWNILKYVFVGTVTTMSLFEMTGCVAKPGIPFAQIQTEQVFSAPISYLAVISLWPRLSEILCVFNLVHNVVTRSSKQFLKTSLD